MPTLEQRVSELEAQMRRVLEREEPQEHPGRWESIVGSFAGAEGFDEAARLGREYRESLRPDDESPD